RRASREIETPLAVEGPAEPSAAPEAPSGRHRGHAPAASDEKLQGKVEAALASSKLTREEDVDVSVEDGLVTLSGHVSSSQAAEVAQALAGAVAGRDKVRSRLTVSEDNPDLPPMWPDLSGIPFLSPRGLERRLHPPFKSDNSGRCHGEEPRGQEGGHPRRRWLRAGRVDRAAGRARRGWRTDEHRLARRRPREGLAAHRMGRCVPGG